MSTTKQYDQLVAEMPPGIQADIMIVLLESYHNARGQNVTRERLILLVFNKVVDKAKLSGSKEDRQIRDSIEELQRQGYRIISSSGRPGYRLAVDDADMEEYIAELESRKASLEEKIRCLRTPRPKYEYVEPEIVLQPALI